MIIKKIVITGGPCGGKTEAKKWIETTGTKFGYAVLFIPETATEFITGGVAPWTCGTNLEFQKIQCELQLKKEELFVRAAMGMPKDKILIVCDRGFMDNKAYMNEEEYNEVLLSLQVSQEDIINGYDAIFHLVSAGKGLAEFYQLDSNVARIETADEAAILDDKVLASWKIHPKQIIIDNEVDFELKMKNLVKQIELLLA